MQIFKEYIASHRERFIEEWKAFLRFKSVSALPENKTDCLSCAKWLSYHIESIGVPNVEMLTTSGLPVVYAHYEGPPNTPHILYYGHYDVYQTNPLIPWKFGAFNPTIFEDRLYARGAQDNKGQTFYFLKALEALIKLRKLNCSITIIVEGEEETTTSSGLIEILPRIKHKLKSDILMVCDTESKDLETPSIVLGVRGIINLSFRLGGIKNDLHSGVHGGVVKNPAQEMAKLLSTLHTPGGEIAVEGFYSGIAALHPEEQRLLDDSSLTFSKFDERYYEEEIGVPPCGGEFGKYSLIERRGFRPTLEINGIYAGYIGPGVKTIIPAYSNAKLTARLVAGQEPAACLSALREHIKRNAPEGLVLTIEEQGIGGSGIRIDPRTPILQCARRVLKRVFCKEPTFSWEGSSVPVIANLIPDYAPTALLVGFGLEEDHVHAEDESFSLKQFENGFLYVCELIDELGKGAREPEYAI